jgi:hypothetical protein
MVTAELRWFKEYKTLQPQMEPKSIFIWVVDNRVFDEAPRSPNIPSLDPSEPQDEKIKLRSIARTRNSFGKGLGDILLEEGQTVESVIHDSLRQSFIESGYTVVENNASMSKGSQIVDVEINKFCPGWIPAFGRSRWAQRSRRTSVSMEATRTNRPIYVKATDHFQAATEGNWLAVMKDALTNYIAEVKTKFRDNQRQSSSGEPLSRILFRPTICLVLLRVIK